MREIEVVLTAPSEVIDEVVVDEVRLHLLVTYCLKHGLGMECRRPKGQVATPPGASPNSKKSHTSRLMVRRSPPSVRL